MFIKLLVQVIKCPCISLEREKNVSWNGIMNTCVMRNCVKEGHLWSRYQSPHLERPLEKCLSVLKFMQASCVICWIWNPRRKYTCTQDWKVSDTRLIAVNVTKCPVKSKSRIAFCSVKGLGLANCVDCFSRNEQLYFNTIKVLAELEGSFVCI